MSSLTGSQLFKPPEKSKLTESGEHAFYQNDPKYRQYAAAVEKALKSFEYTSEWADLISALGKLNKVSFGFLRSAVHECEMAVWF